VGVPAYLDIDPPAKCCEQLLGRNSIGESDNVFQVMGKTNRDTGRLDHEYVADPGVHRDSRPSAIALEDIPIAATNDSRRDLCELLDHREHMQVPRMEYPVAAGKRMKDFGRQCRTRLRNVRVGH
jgi:hypothetical protein